MFKLKFNCQWKKVNLKLEYASSDRKDDSQKENSFLVMIVKGLLYLSSLAGVLKFAKVLLF